VRLNCSGPSNARGAGNKFADSGHENDSTATVCGAEQTNFFRHEVASDCSAQETRLPARERAGTTQMSPSTD
jgi:hypothetical protein